MAGNGRIGATFCLLSPASLLFGVKTVVVKGEWEQINQRYTVSLNT